MKKIHILTLIGASTALAACQSKSTVNVHNHASANARSSASSGSGSQTHYATGDVSSSRSSQNSSNGSNYSSRSSSSGSSYSSSSVTSRSGNSSSQSAASSSSKSYNIIGTWSGVSRGGKISVKFGSNGSLILTNTAGANPGSWNSSGGGNFHVNIGGATGQMVLLNSSTASLTIGGSSIELRK